MIFKLKFYKFFKIFLLTITLTSFFTSCGIYKPVDARKIPAQAKDRAKQNVSEGRGVSVNNILKNRGSTNFEFSSSNPLWRASLETLDFLPLTTVDYSGGVIISDWYSDGSDKNESLKITIRFLSNEVRSDSLKILIHNKICDKNLNCNIVLLKSKIEDELKLSIIKKAALLEKVDQSKK